MTYKSVLLGLSAIGGIVIDGPAIAQTTAKASALPTVPATLGTKVTPAAAAAASLL